LSAECASRKIFKNWSIIGKDIDKSKVPFFMAHGVYYKLLAKFSPYLWEDF